MRSPSASDQRPAWMTALAAVCALTVVVSVFRDLFLPANRWMEIWFGFEITGWPALVTAPIHWAIFAIGAYGFWNQRGWAAPCAAGYLFYAALAHLVWSEVSPHGRGIAVGLAQAAALSFVAWLVFRAGRRDEKRPASS